MDGDEGARLAQELERDISLDINKLVSTLKGDAVGDAALKVFSAKVKQLVHKTNEVLKQLQAAKLETAKSIPHLSGFLQEAFKDVYDLVSSNAEWQARAEWERVMAVEAAEMYLNRIVFNVVFCTDDEAVYVDDRLARLFEGLSFVELRNFRMPAYLVTAIENNTSHFAAAVSALYALQDRHTEGNKFPRDKLRCFALFYNHLVKLIASEGGEGNADELMDVALYTLLVVKPRSLYSTVRYVEQFRWTPLSTAGFSGFLLGWVESLLAMVYTINVHHFDVDKDTFLAHLVSSGFEAEEFEPRPPHLPLPAPFGRGPPLGGPSAAGPRAEAPSSPSSPVLPEVATRNRGDGASPTSSPEKGRSSDGGQGRRSRGRSEEHASTSVTLPSTIAEIESAGAERLRSARNLQHMHRMYPFLQQQAHDMFLKDVPDLLAQYQDMAIKYESLRVGLKKFGVK